MIKKDNNKSESHPGKLHSGNGSARSQKSNGSTLEDLLKKGLKEIFDAEMQLVESLPKLAKSCYNEDLEDAINKHLRQTKRQLERLDKVYNRLGITRKEHEDCQAMKGLIDEANEIITEFEESHVRDSALIIAAQKIEHYQIAVYGSLCELSDVLGYYNITDLLGRSLDEEEKADLELTDIAMYVNDEAYETSEEFG